MRESILLRSGHAGAVPLPEAPTAAAFRRLWRAGLGKAVVERMTEERSELIARWRRENLELERVHGCELVDELNWAERNSFGARVFSRGFEPDRPASFQVELNVGLQIAIDETMCTVFSQRSFLKNYEIDFDLLTEPFFLSQARSVGSMDYPPIEHCMRNPTGLMWVVPRSPPRLRAAAALSELCLDWIHFHEQSHYMLGHLDLLAGRHGRGVIAQIDEGTLSLHGGRGSVGRRVRRVMEFQADAFALELLFLHYLLPNRGRRASFDAAYLALDLDMSSVLGTAPDLTCLRRVSRTLIVAASTVALMLEQRTLAVGQDRQHPLPSSRLFSLIINGANITKELFGYIFVIRGRQEPSDDQWADLIVRLVVECLADVLLAAMVLGIQDPSLRYEPPAARPLDTDFTDDIFRTMSSEEITPDIIRALVTPGAREFARMQPHNDRVFAQLDLTRHGGALLRDR